jgi:hypothetical protein
MRAWSVRSAREGEQAEKHEATQSDPIVHGGSITLGGPSVLIGG